ncbi:PREDICTED: chaperone protein dnaJ 49-like [Tarenaya hassleriana]|uniref:chaperone protein dnaJ 49-like n=1 Tax=Tarenaya hassleriana TaxID=28532 RepID=UPI0008FD4B40|nr:PREDICTED: chaperone protein dnaJ 49-like [Tarenaya hassleriana]
MDGNKDDALKCLKIGKDAMEAGDRARALKFLTKACRLDPSLPIDNLVSELEKQSDDPTAEGSPGSAAKESPKASGRPSLRQRGPSASAAAGSSSSGSASYTEEQIAIVRQIKSKKDYYEILGLEKSCSVEDLRKAYRKLSLKVHPDKNKAPGSEEAFKFVSKAFQCLSNEETRRKYDISGSDEPVYQPRRAARRNGFNGYYDDEFDADEIFRSFFFGGMPPATAQFRTFNFGGGMGGQRTANQASDAGFNVRVLLQLLPVLLILLLNFLPSSQPVYSLSASYPYEYKFTTNRGVNYFVRSSKFEQEYPLNSLERQRTEAQVERDYYSVVSQNCRYELQRQQWGFIRETPHCDMLRKFESAA